MKEESCVLNITTRHVKREQTDRMWRHPKITAAALRAILLVVIVAVFPEVLTAQDTGSIRGVLDHAIARRISGAVYVETIVGNENMTFEIPELNPVMDQVNLTYTPHVLPVLAGSTISFPNSDSTRHHVYTSKTSVCQFELGIYDAGTVKHATCPDPGVIMLLCNVHAEMKGFVVVSPTPYFSQTDNTGGFFIEAVPPGRYRLRIEHERLESKLIEVDVLSGQETIVLFDEIKRKRR